MDISEDKWPDRVPPVSQHPRPAHRVGILPLTLLVLGLGVFPPALQKLISAFSTFIRLSHRSSLLQSNFLSQSHFHSLQVIVLPQRSSLEGFIAFCSGWVILEQIGCLTWLVEKRD